MPWVDSRQWCVHMPVCTAGAGVHHGVASVDVWPEEKCLQQQSTWFCTLITSALYLRAPYNLEHAAIWVIEANAVHDCGMGAFHLQLCVVCTGRAVAMDHHHRGYVVLSTDFTQANLLLFDPPSSHQPSQRTTKMFLKKSWINLPSLSSAMPSTFRAQAPLSLHPKKSPCRMKHCLGGQACVGARVKGCQTCVPTLRTVAGAIK